MSTKWNVVASSVPGSSHTRLGTPCQDSFLYLKTGNFLIGAVADGAGSAANAEVGSSVAVSAAVKKVADLISATQEISDQAITSFMQRGVTEARRALECEAQNRSIDLRDLATTLIVFVATGDSVIATQIGDGAIVALSTSGTLKAITTPPQGEYINETTFLVSANWSDAIQIGTMNEQISGIAAFSDGLQLLALQLPEAIPFERFFLPLFNFVRETEEGASANNNLAEFLNSPRVNARTDDDKTLLLATVALN